MRYLLDTDTCISILRNRPSTVRLLAAVAPSDCGVSTISAYELYTGVEKCSQPASERAKVDLLLQTLPLVSFQANCAQEAARIRAFLESQGQSIGPYDLLLAGQAFALSLILVTSNTREFSRVPGLALEDWS